MNQKVSVIDINKVKNDENLEEKALNIIEKSGFVGEVTKIDGDIYFISFKNDEGWVTQGFKANEIKGLK